MRLIKYGEVFNERTGEVRKLSDLQENPHELMQEQDNLYLLKHRWDGKQDLAEFIRTASQPHLESEEEEVYSGELKTITQKNYPEVLNIPSTPYQQIYKQVEKEPQMSIIFVSADRCHACN